MNYPVWPFRGFDSLGGTLPAGKELLGLMIGVVLVAYLGGTFALSFADSAQGLEQVTKEFAQGETKEIYGPINATADTISKNPAEVNLTITNTDTDISESHTIAEGGTQTFTLAGEEIDATVDSIASNGNSAVVTFELDRDAFLTADSQRLVRIMIFLALLGGVALLFLAVPEVIS